MRLAAEVVSVLQNTLLTSTKHYTLYTFHHTLYTLSLTSILLLFSFSVIYYLE